MHTNVSVGYRALSVRVKAGPTATAVCVPPQRPVCHDLAISADAGVTAGRDATLPLMGHPGGQDANWQRRRPGYRLTAPRHRDPVRGFPPTRDARDTGYLRSHGQDGSVALTGREQDRSGGAATGAAAPQRQRQARRVRARRRGRHRVLLMICAAVAMAVALAATAVYAFTVTHKTAAASSARPAKSQPSAPAPTPPPHRGKWQYITSRADDPIALTLTELFPARVSAGPRSYLRTAQRARHGCRGAVFGSRLAAVAHKGCSQALRASYLSANGERMGTIGVLNLATASAAAKAGMVVTAPRQFIRPLPGLHGATRNLGMGTGVVWGMIKGHYLILMWAQYANLHRPASSRDRKALLQVDNDLYQATVNQSLTQRMLTGQPLAP